MTMETKIKLDGDTWRVLSMGVERDGKTFCHLASTTRGQWQRNGFHPTQICDWIPNEQLTALKAVNDYYTDRNNSGQAALTAHR